MYVAPIGGELDLRAHHDPGRLAGDAVGVHGADPGVGPGVGSHLVEVPLEPGRHARGVEAGRELRAAVGEPAALVADRAGEHDAEAARRAALDDRLHEVALLPGDVDVRAGRGGEAGAGLGGLVVGLGHDSGDPVVEQALPGLLEEEPADRADHDRGQHHGAGDDTGLDRPAPEGERAPQRHRQAAGGHGRADARNSRPCTPHHAPSPRSRGSRGRARPWTGGAARAR